MKELARNELGREVTGRAKYLKLRHACALLIILWFGLADSAAFAATTHWVNDDDPSPPSVAPGTSCSNPGYQSIQDAVDAAAPGDTIRVCQGIYSEQIFVMGPGKNNLTLLSVVPLQATIKAPLVMTEPGDLVTIDNTQNVTVRDFVVAGPFPDALFCSLNVRSGVRVKGGGSALIFRNRITEIRSTNPALRGCQNGVAVQVGRRFEGQTGSARITANLIDNYQKNGMTIDNIGSSAVITGNDVRGNGPDPIIAQNGIQVSRGAFADVRNNIVSDNTYALAPAFGSTGILLFGAPTAVPPIPAVAPGTTVAQNFLVRNDDNIGVYGTSGIKILDNRALNSTFFDGIFMNVDTSNNRLAGNFLRNNTEHDCHDDSVGPNNPPALVANFWINNNGVTENKPGLCRGDNEDQDDDDFDDDGRHNHIDDDDDNDGQPDTVDEDDDNDGQRDDDDEDDDNDNISDVVDSDARETQRSSSGTVAGGHYEDRTMAVDAGTLALSGLVEAPNAQALRVAIYDPAGLLVGISQPVLGRASIKVPVTLPGIYTVRVQNTGTEPIDFVVRLIASVPWP
jgi:hypothetical protein